jgi:hypothetical protein
MKNLILSFIAAGGLVALAGCASDNNTPSTTTTTTTTEQQSTSTPASYGGPEGTGNSVQGAGGS